MIHPDDIAPGLEVTIRRRCRRVHFDEHLPEHFHVLEPGTVTEVKRTKAGRVTQIEARNEVSGRVHWFTSRLAPDGVTFGYFKKGLEQSKPYELILERMDITEEVTTRRTSRAGPGVRAGESE